MRAASASSLTRIENALAQFNDPRLPPSANAQNPTVLFVPDLPAKPLWNSDAAVTSLLKHVLSQRVAIRDEVSRRALAPLIDDGDGAGWRRNDCARGDWHVFPLISQGVLFEENTARLPLTTAALLRVDGLGCSVHDDDDNDDERIATSMQRCCFGEFIKQEKFRLYLKSYFFYLQETHLSALWAATRRLNHIAG